MVSDAASVEPASKLTRREEVAEGTLLDPPETDAEGNTRTFSIVSPPFENELVIATRMRDTAFKRSLKKVPAATQVKR